MLAGGVTSNWQITQPQPVWLSHGAGGKVYDVDGNEYVDLHGGYGAALAGHAHPAIVRAVKAQVEQRHPLRAADAQRHRRRQELAGRWGLPRWRFANSGTEATMDAVHLMRSYTGRDLIIKVEGGYHGHHDSVQVSVMPDDGRGGPAGPPAPGPVLERHPAGDHQPHPGRPVQRPGQRRKAPRGTPRPGRRHDRRAHHDERRASSHPLPGYLAGLRDLLHDHGALLTFDEVKTGLTVGPGGVTGSRASPRTSSAWPSRSAAAWRSPRSAAPPTLMDHVATGGYEMVGTFNGNPLAMAAARAMLTEVATEETYRRIEGLRQRAAAGITAAIEDFGLNGSVVTAGRQGLRRLRGAGRSPTTASFLAVDDSLSHAHWLFQHNGGVFLPPWGKIEQWLISVQHDEAGHRPPRRQLPRLCRGRDSAADRE